ncbi:unnamed protein product, partial [Vitis vinifera]|uniref:Uncharacterized protein n=1 Tax=Vitis vinifera TaxID=29760 RepID=D7TWQ7_VITVI
MYSFSKTLFLEQEYGLYDKLLFSWLLMFYAAIPQISRQVNSHTSNWYWSLAGLRFDQRAFCDLAYVTFNKWKSTCDD